MDQLLSEDPGELQETMDGFAAMTCDLSQARIDISHNPGKSSREGIERRSEMMGYRIKGKQGEYENPYTALKETPRAGFATLSILITRRN